MMYSKSLLIAASATACLTTKTLVSAYGDTDYLFDPLVDEKLHFEYFEFTENNATTLSLSDLDMEDREREFNDGYVTADAIQQFNFFEMDWYYVLPYYPPDDDDNATRMLEEGQDQAHRELLRLCGRCKSAKKYMKCLKNKCGSRKKTTGGGRLLHEDIHAAANKIRQQDPNLRGLQGKKQTEEEKELSEAEKAAAKLAKEVELDWDMAVIKMSINNRAQKDRRHRKGNTDHKVAFDMHFEEPEEDVCKMQEFLGECKTSAGPCNNKYTGLEVTSCDSSSILGGICMCGTEPCGCNAAVQEGRCTKHDYKEECDDVDFCKGKYPDKGAYDCKLHQGGVCYCGPGQVCGCMPETPIEES